MKRLIISIFIFVALAIQVFAVPAVTDTSVTLKTLAPEPFHHREEQMITFLLARNHYQHKDINDSLSVEVYKNYIQRLDGNRLYFLQADLNRFARYRFELDDDLKAGVLKPAYRIFNVFLERFKQRIDYALKRLQKPFNFTIDEYYEPNREKEPWAKTNAELDKLWDKKLKNEALNLKLAGKKGKNIAKTLKKRYRNYLKRIEQSEDEDVFQYFMNSFAETFDPHTAYMSPKRSADFKIQMSHSLEGIGAVLSTEDDYTKVVEIVSGGPADKAGELHANDRISAVGQGDSGEMVDVIGWRIDDVVQLIRGPKGTTVRLQILPADAPLGSTPKIIKIVRDKVRLVDKAAKSDTLNIVEKGRPFKLGVIDIPDFYFDYDAMRRGDPSFASTSKDVKRLLSELQSAGAQGIIIDLRGNGGGFLNEAVKLGGLFIKKGPIVQVRNSGGKVEVNRDDDPAIYYNGPLVVLVNRLSASASEIFAAAIQDYGRGIIVGDQSYGKGTVQNIIRLQRFFPHSSNKYGQVKMTIAKFYRINGGSTQNVGVMPDITFPSRLEAMEVGERYQKYALLWDQIRPAPFTPYPINLHPFIPRLRSMHQARIKNNPEFKKTLEDIKRIEENRKKNRIPLRESERRKELKKEKGTKKKNKKKDDFVLNETARILSDLIILQGENLQTQK